MSFTDRISQTFKMFYDDVESQVSHLQKSDSFFSQLTKQSDDAKMLNRIEKGEVSSKEVDELIKTAKEFGAELENLRQKVARRKMQKVSVKSKMPPMWDEGKLSTYIESIVEEIFDSNEENEKRQMSRTVEKPSTVKSASSSVKPILKTEKSKTTKRNVATNVKFQIHQSKSDELASNNKETTIKKSNKKVQTKTQAQLKLDSSNKTNSPCRVERSLSGRESQDVSFVKSDNLIKPKTTPVDLKYSPLTVTSTAENHQSTNKETDDLVHVIESRLATNNTQNAKQMTTRCLPVLSIKGSCSIQKIYQLEVSPSRDVYLPNNNHRENTKFVEFVHQPPSSNVHFEPQLPTQSSNENLKNLNDKNEVQSNFIDIRDVNRMLGNCGIHLRDGKVHVVVEKTGVKKSSKKARARKSLKPSTLRKSIDDLEKSSEKADDNEEEKINIDKPSRDKNEKKIEDVEINEMDSSMSSSITDDGKLRQILKINRDGEKRARSLARHSSSDSYPSSTGNGDNSFPPQTADDIGRVVNENFQSIYKLIEETFQPVTDVNENEREIGDDGMKQMREIIKMSEENIKRAGKLLQKYHRNDEPPIIEIDTSRRQSPTLPPSNLTKSNDKSMENLAQSVETDIKTSSDDKQDPDSHQLRITEPRPMKKETAESSVQTAENKNVQTDGNLNWKSRQYFGNVYEQFSNFNHIKFDQQPTSFARHNPYCSPFQPCNCFGCEKRRSFQVSNYQSILDSGKSSPHHSPLKSASMSPKLPVAYNPIYSDDDEVMKAANKFLRSVEKQKNRNAESDVTSSESSKIFTPQKLFSRSNSSSISTPSSPLNNATQSGYEHHVSCAENNLGSSPQNSEEELKSQEKLKEVRRFSEEIQLNRSSSSSPQLDLSDLQLNQEFLERYLSEGEVLSQGEIQLGLSDDDVPDDF